MSALLGILLVMVIWVGGHFAMSLVLWALWNAAAVPIFHAPHASYWQAVCALGMLTIIGSAFRTVTK
jgi:uncharacterized membrane protein